MNKIIVIANDIMGKRRVHKFEKMRRRLNTLYMDYVIVYTAVNYMTNSLSHPVNQNNNADCCQGK